MRISLEEAQAKIFFHHRKHSEICGLTESAGRIAARLVYAAFSQPPFRRSAMDGYAVRTRDIEPGKTYVVTGEIDAGDGHSYHLDKGQVMRIMTGAPCPVNADKVIPQEMSDYGDSIVSFHDIPVSDNICPVGEDFLAGELLIPAGTIMNAPAIACAAAQTCDFVITTGGVSVGKKDLIKEALIGLGGHIVFHGIDIKPGMPTMFSIVNHTPVLSLSGNPFAASCLFELLNPFRSPICTEAILAHHVSSKRPCRRIVRGFWDGSTVQLLPRDKNGVTRNGIGNNCLAELPTGNAALEKGTKVKVYLPYGAY